ncbi:MAG: glycoside hydrolase family 5 protein [Oscillospiraceae bacterium]|jgi:endoglucanase|nr:glycoside hydrolase family 5 protein [Oscillospiraceae bacterium]
MKLKRIITLTVFLFLVIGITACSDGTDPGTPSDGSTGSLPGNEPPYEPAESADMPPSPDTSADDGPDTEPPYEIPVPDVTKKEIPDTEALRFTAGMMNGWNLGNTFDASGDWYTGPEENYETIWVGVKTSKAMIDTLKTAGFNSIRIPVTWHPHVDEDFTISEVWLSRVNEVVDYAWDNGMTVILNIHHDDGVDFVYPDSEHFESSARYISRIWEQVAARFAGYGENLIFEGLNEPRLVGTQYEWWQDMGNDICRDALDTLCNLNQIFVDTVRAAGGCNETRYLMVSGLGANADTAVHSRFRLPEDTAENKIIISVHAYTPYNFALQGPNESGSVSEFDMTKTSNTKDIDSFMDKLYKTYISNGIPVVIGEFGARKKGDNDRSRAEFTAYYTASARARGIPCIWWDNHGLTGDGELFGLLDRNKLEWVYPKIVEALLRELE